MNLPLNHHYGTRGVDVFKRRGCLWWDRSSHSFWLNGIEKLNSRNIWWPTTSHFSHKPKGLGIRWSVLLRTVDPFHFVTSQFVTQATFRFVMCLHTDRCLINSNFEGFIIIQRINNTFFSNFETFFFIYFLKF